MITPDINDLYLTLKGFEAECNKVVKVFMLEEDGLLIQTIYGQIRIDYLIQKLTMFNNQDDKIAYIDLQDREIALDWNQEYNEAVLAVGNFREFRIELI